MVIMGTIPTEKLLGNRVPIALDNIACGIKASIIRMIMMASNSHKTTASAICSYPVCFFHDAATRSNSLFRINPKAIPQRIIHTSTCVDMLSINELKSHLKPSLPNIGLIIDSGYIADTTQEPRYTHICNNIIKRVKYAATRSTITFPLICLQLKFYSSSAHRLFISSIFSSSALTTRRVAFIPIP